VSTEPNTDCDFQELYLPSPTTQKLVLSSASSSFTSEAWHHRKPFHDTVCYGSQHPQSQPLTPHSTVQTMQAYMQPAMNALRQPASLMNRVATEASNTTPQNLLAQVRGMSNAQWASIGVVAAEVIGFFSVGEIIGRFKLVGYRAKEHGGDH
jgi:hypothetical protein